MSNVYYYATYEADFTKITGAKQVEYMKKEERFSTGNSIWNAWHNHSRVSNVDFIAR